MGFVGTARFELRRRLGAGGMGIVHEAYDHERGARVALKEIRRLDAATLVRFKREFRTLHDLVHPNVISLGELVCDGPDWFFTMELISGVDLLSYVCGTAGGEAAAASPSPTQTRTRTADRDPGPTVASPPRPPPPRAGRLDERRLRSVLAQLARALAAVHRRGLVHRDLKPANVLVDDGGRVVVLDFGLIALAGAASEAVGTPAYMAPEQLVGQAVGPAADWYAVGVMLYEALVGQRPYGGHDAIQLALARACGPPAPPPPGAPADLVSLALALLDPDPARRPDALAVLRCLGATPDPDPAQTAPFIGRQVEGAALHRAYDEARAGTAVAVVIDGASGLGKSELLAHFTAELRRRAPEALVLIGRCFERETAPFKAFDAIVETLGASLARAPAEVARLAPADAAALVRLFPALQQVDPLGAAAARSVATDVPADGVGRVRHGAVAFRELLRRVAGWRPLVLLIDDLHWAGTDSVALLEEVLAPHVAPPVLLIATARAAMAFPAALGVALRRIALAPLPDADVASLAAALLPPEAAGRAAQVAAIVRASHGHPRFVHELARAGLAPGDAPIDLDAVIAARVARLSAAARGVLALLAIAGGPHPVALIGAAAGLAPEDHAQVVAQLRDEALVRTDGVGRGATMAPFHDRVTAAVGGGLDAAARRQLHARLVAVLDAADATVAAPDLLARHLEGAGEPGRAAAVARAAATRALERGAHDLAAEALATALRLTPGGDDARRPIQLELADALAAAGRGPAAAAALLRASEGAASAQRGVWRRRAAEQLLMSGHLERGQALLGEMLGELGLALPRSPRRAVAAVVVQRLRLRLGLRPVRLPREPRTPAPPIVERLATLRAVAQGYQIVDPALGAAFHTRHLRLALAAGEPGHVATGIAAEAGYLAAMGPAGLARVRGFRDDARAHLAISPDAPYLEAGLHVIEGWLEFFDGGMRRAAAHFARAEAAPGVRSQTAFERTAVRMWRVMALLYGGALAELRALVDETLRDAARRGDLLRATTVRGLTAAVVHLAAADPDRAARELADATWGPGIAGPHVQHLFVASARAAIASYRGDAADLAAVAAQVDALRRSPLMRLPNLRATIDHLDAHVALTRGDARRAARLAPGLARSPSGAGRFAGAVMAAAAAAAVGDEPRAAGHLRAAIALADAHQLGLGRVAAQWRLGELLGEPAPVAAAAAWLRGEGVIDPPRYLATLIAPLARRPGAVTRAAVAPPSADGAPSGAGPG
ncbi:MAG: protein kinase [Kofleriaceae bacterium]|nr:protein kinase [Kofleriaceae bacterium]